MTRKQQIEKIKKHLKNYKVYKVGMKNIQQSLDEILPNITTDYSWKENSKESLNNNSSTENTAIYRLEGEKVAYLQQQLAIYKTIINSIDEAVKALTEDEEKFIKYRYFEGWSIEKTALELGYSVQNCFKIRTQAMNKLLISLRNLIKFPLS
ncbi:DNA-directed RNA polymerase specialized sigma24 family protein [Desulfohalotomaculum tongense]|uniref:sigma factor-like helix-turn-helix DNA-binding protein n=1 Tax=Desulforadius tongensis TaxID=1216062 RepID=UPI001959D81F|nr:sigma factor-like helix-turn-helix DNA-binding protein [Desulforadius tongensis]MBM7853987.1 DNA-directed RNA polymerase specialized sigma24 family protein [Desulforadius tongensis]